MSFTSGGMSGAGFGGAEEVLAFMIKAYDMATPVFRAFGGEVEATTKKIRGALLELNKATISSDRAVTDATARSAASLKELQLAYESTAVKSADLAAMQAKMAKESVTAADTQAAAARRAADVQVAAAGEATAASERSVAGVQRMGKLTLEAMAGAAIGSLDFATKFQANTLRMETQAGATAKGLDQIRHGLLKMAGEVGFTPDQLSTGMYHVVSAMNAVLPPTTRVAQELQIMKVAAEGAKVGHSNLEETVYALSAAMNALHLQGNSATKVMAELNAVVGSGDMTMQDLVDAMKSGIIPAAQTFGISLQSVGAALAVMGDMGMRGALAGTRLRMAISLLAAPTKQAAGILETLGMNSKQALATTENMSLLLKKAGISVSTLSQDLRKPDGLQVALADLNKHMRNNGLSADAAGAAIDRAFGGGRMGATIKLLAENTDRLGLKFSQITQLSSHFGQDWKLTSETFKVQLEKALASLEAFGIELGTKLLPYATTALHDLQELANWFLKNKAALDILAGAVGTFAAVTIGSYLIGRLKNAIGLVKELGGAFGRVGGFMMGSNLGPRIESRSPLTQSQLEASLGRTGGIAMGGPLGTLESAAGGGIWGVNATQIRVGTLMNPMAVVPVGGHGFGGGMVPVESGGGVPGVDAPAATASAKATQEALNAELKKLETAVGAGALSGGPIIQNAAGRFYAPAGTNIPGVRPGQLVSDAQAATLNTIATTPPGMASLAEMQATEAADLQLLRTKTDQLMWHTTHAENIPSIWGEGLRNNLAGELARSDIAATFLSNDPQWSHSLGMGRDFYNSEPGMAALRVKLPPTWPPLAVDPEHYSQGSALGMPDMPFGGLPHAFYTTQNIPPHLISAAGYLDPLESEMAAVEAELGWSGVHPNAIGGTFSLAKEQGLKLQQQASQMLLDRQFQPQLFQDTHLFQGGLGASLGGEAAAAGQLSLFGTVPETAAAQAARYTALGEGSPFAGMGPSLAREHLAGKLSGLGGFMRGAGGAAMRGMGVAGMGVMGAQMVGAMVPGQAGSMISNVGSMAALGAGIGTMIEPGIGTAIGGALGGVGALIEHFFGGGQTFGQNEAGRLTRGFGGGQRQTIQEQISKAIDQMAGIVHPGTRPTGTGRGAGFGAQEITLATSQLTPTQLDKYMALAKTAGGSIAKQLEAGWSQYKFQSEPVMFTQLRAELKGMPPAVQAFGVQSAVSYAQGLEKSGKLPAGAAQQMLQQIEAQFPAFTRYLGITADASIQQFNKALDFSHAQDNVKKLLDRFRSDFPQVTAVMDSTGGSVIDKAAAVTQALDSIVHGPHSTQAMKTAALADLRDLHAGVAQSFTQAAQLVDQKSQDMAASVKGGSASAAATATTNFDNLSQNIASAIGAGAMSAQAGFKIIADTTNQMIKAFGGHPVPVPQLMQAQQLTSLFSQGRTGVGGVLTAGSTGHFTGGKVHQPTYMVGEEGPAHPEYVLATNPAYRSRNMALWAQYAREMGIPGFAKGGYVFPFPSGEKFGWDRIDQGQDLQGPPGGPVLAIGPGMVSAGHDVFSGFGPSYPIERMASGPWAGRGVYYGHAKDTVTGLVRAGQIIGYTQAHADQWTAAPAGWLELGFTSALGSGNMTAGAAVAPMLHALASGHMVAGSGGMGSIVAPRVSGGGAIGQIVQGAINAVTLAANLRLGAGGAGPVSMGGGSVEQQVASFMHAAGFNKIAIAGLLGNAMQESSMRPGAPGGGLWQQISNFGGGSGGSLLHQMQVMLPQIEGLKSGMNAAGSPGRAAVLFEQRFEKAGIPALANRIAYANAAYAAGYAHGGVPAWGGAYGQGGSFTAFGPTLAMFGEGGVPETVFAVPHFQTGGVTGPPKVTQSTSTNAKGVTTVTTAVTQTVVAGDQKTITVHRSSSSGADSTTVTTEPITPKTTKSAKLTVGFNPMTDRIETHTTDEWRHIHAEYSKQRHDAATAKKKYDKWLAETTTDMLTIGGSLAGFVDLTNKQALAGHLPTGGALPLTSRSMGNLNDAGFKRVLSGMKTYLGIDSLADVMKLLHKDIAALGHGGASPTSRMGQVSDLIGNAALKGVTSAFTSQQKQFQHTVDVMSLIEKTPPGTTVRTLGFSPAQLKALGLTRADVRHLAGTDGGPAALKQQINELSTQVIPAYRADAQKLTNDYKLALKTHNKKLQAELLAQLDAVSQAEAQAIADRQSAQVSAVEATYQQGQAQADKLQSGADIVGAIANLPTGTNLGAIGLTPGVLGALGLPADMLNQVIGGANPMQAAAMQNYALAGERGTDTNTLNQLLAQLPTLKGSAADAATQHILDLSKAVASLTSQINTNLLQAIQATAQGFQDQADQAAGANDMLAAIGDMPAGTNLSALGLSPGLLATLGISPGTAAGVQGFGPASIQDYLNLQGNTLTPQQIAGATSYYNTQNAGIQAQLGGPGTGLIGELNFDYSQLGSLSGKDYSDFLSKTILPLAKEIAGLSRTMQDNTNAVAKLTSTMNASTSSTGQLTGTVAYSYQGQNFLGGPGGMSSETPINFGVGS